MTTPVGSAGPAGGHLEPPPTTPTAPRRAAAARVRSWVAGVLAGLVVVPLFFAPAVGEPATAVLRIPLEGMLAMAIVLNVPARARTGVTVALGILLGLWAIVRIVDVGFATILARPFDPVLDWGFLKSGVDVLGRSLGERGASLAVAVVAAAAVAVVALVTAAVLHLSRLVVRHPGGSTRAVAVLLVAWVAAAVTGADVAGRPVAARDYADRLANIWTVLRSDRAVFAGEVERDAYRETPGEQLLTALRGKDVVIVLVESYGRVAVEDPLIAPSVVPVLHEGASRLEAAGFAARSGYLTSPTVGGGSWLADATLLSGAWVSNQLRYTDLAASRRLPLTGAFRRAGWRTVAVMPGVTMDWPEAPYYAFDRIVTHADLGYVGPIYSFDTMPDQYVLSYFERTEHALREPVMAVIPLISSHAPWTPLPDVLDWREIGDGSAYPPPTQKLEPAESVLKADPSRVKADYAKAMVYSLSTVLSYVETFGDDDLVLIFLGDHQPVPVVTGATDNRDVPISIVTRDRAVLARTDGWGWQDGLVPGPGAPVWRMDTFRDRFLDAFR